MENKKEMARLQKKVSKWVKEWVADEASIEIFRDDPIEFLNSYLHEKTESILLGNRIDEALSWHFANYMNEVLNEREESWVSFSLAAHYARALVKFEEAFADNNQGGLILPDYAFFFFSLNVLSGWTDEFRKVGHSLYKGLDTPLLDLRHCDEHEAGSLYRHFWFLMHLFCETEGLSLDTSLYSYPEDMTPYAEVLDDWRTTDMKKVQDFISAMADFHIKEARTTAHDEIAEFDTEDRMIFPYEILCWLRLREWAGLPNPETFDHPLMNQPLAKMPTSVPLPKPETPLLDQVIEKFKKEYPGSFE